MRCHLSGSKHEAAKVSFYLVFKLSYCKKAIAWKNVVHLSGKEAVQRALHQGGFKTAIKKSISNEWAILKEWIKIMKIF